MFSTVSDDESESDLSYDEAAPVSAIDIMIRNPTTQQVETFHVLLDSGTRSCMGTADAVRRAGLRVKEEKRRRRFRTAAGVFETRERATIRAHHILE
jgi:Aspartyl protease